MLKFEKVAKVGDYIKAFDFEPMPSRPDAFLIGKVIDKGTVGNPAHGYKAYTVEVVDSDDESKDRIGSCMFVPFESSMDYDNRVTKVEFKSREEEDLGAIGARIMANAICRATASKSKKAAAEKLFKDFGHNGRQYMIKMFMDHLAMSKSGASTYYYNCKKAA